MVSTCRMTRVTWLTVIVDADHARATHKIARGSEKVWMVLAERRHPTLETAVTRGNFGDLSNRTGFAISVHSFGRSAMSERRESTIESEEQLRAILPAPPTVVARKKIDHFEEATQRFLAESSCIGVATKRDGGISVTARFGPPGFARASADGELEFDDGPAARLGGHLEAELSDGGIGLLFLIPGIPETLRLNGTVVGHSDRGEVRVRLGEAYFHCPKAFVRAKLWSSDDRAGDAPAASAEAGETISDAHRAYLETARFALLGTHDGSGGFDVSPRGDPGGLVRVLDERTVFLPERPGNRIADSLRNILATREASLLAVVPGHGEALHLRGSASLVNTADLLEATAERGRAPKLGIRIEVDSVASVPSPALAASAMWDHGRHVDPKNFPTMGQLLLQQMDPKGRGQRVKAFVLDRMLNRDVSKNLY